MATSGDITFNLDRDSIIKLAMQHMHRLPAGASPSSNDLTDMGNVLNSMLKAWQAQGTNLWLRQRMYVFLQPGQREYALHLTNTSTTAEAATSFYATALDGAHSASATSISLVDGANTANSDRIGILLDDNTMHWTTISSGGGTDTVVIASGLASAAADTNLVYFYTTRAARPRKILTASLVEGPTSSTYGDTNTTSTQTGFHDRLDGIQTQVDLLGLNDWTLLSNKGADGQVSQIWYDPQWKQANLTVWPEPDIGSDYLLLTVERTVEDLDAATDDFDLPHEWYLAIQFNLAFWCSDMYGVSDKIRNSLREKAAMAFDLAAAGDTEDHWYLQPDNWGRM